MTSHPGHQPFDVVEVEARGQRMSVQLFPPHCVAGAPGAQLAGVWAGGWMWWHCSPAAQLQLCWCSRLQYPYLSPNLPADGLEVQHVHHAVLKGRQAELESFSAFSDMAGASTGAAGRQGRRPGVAAALTANCSWLTAAPCPVPRL